MPNARYLLSVTAGEAAGLTFYGSEVIHHLALALTFQVEPPIEISIKDLQEPRGQGIAIVPELAQSSSQQMNPLRPRNGTISLTTTRRHPTAGTVKRNITVLRTLQQQEIRVSRISPGFFAKVFSILEGHGISVDFISTSEVYSQVVKGWLSNGSHLSIDRIYFGMQIVLWQPAQSTQHSCTVASPNGTQLLDHTRSKSLHLPIWSSDVF
ncbi:hypothetical protein BJ170DRAFT_599901 [Xylariales sp. AK1849]|nr:hypothetical protein BJ170DRAFT_599901 [Xylariales sp. AK1849]